MAARIPRMLIPLAGLISSVAALQLANGVRAEPILTTHGGQTAAAKFVGVGGDGSLRFRRGSSDQSLAPRELFSWGAPAPCCVEPFVVLADGGVLVGEVQSITGDILTLRSPVLDVVEVPRAAVAGFCPAFSADCVESDRRRQFLLGVDASGRAQDARRAADATFPDEILLADGEILPARIGAFANQNLNIQTVVGTLSLDIGRVLLARLGIVQRTLASKALAVGLADGTTMFAIGMESADRQEYVRLHLAAADGLDRQVPVKEIVFLQNLARPIIYFSDVEPAHYLHIPYFHNARRYARDKDLDGGPLRAGGREYLKGLAMPPASRLVYKLDRGSSEFRATLAIHDRTDGRGSVRFRVLCRRRGNWREDYASQVIRGGDPPREIALGVHDADGLTLIVDFADGGHVLDDALWLDARVVLADRD